MGLTIHFELHAPSATSEDDVAERIARLQAHARTLPFEDVSEIVRLDARALDGPWPIRGLVYDHLDDVVHVGAALGREWRYRTLLGVPIDDMRRVDLPPALPTVAIGFAVAPGRGCEPATFGLMRLTMADGATDWWWMCSCKTQYASTVDDDHFVRCHASLVRLLDSATEIGLAPTVEDEGGYWESRDPRALVAHVTHMNRLIARFAGALTDAIRDGGGDSRQLQGSIFEHPDFERLETPE